MYKGKRILGVITARSGSKSVQDKNIKMLCGKPLIAYTIEASNKSKYLTRCVVSTDSEHYIEIAKRYGADVPFKRPKVLATDTARSMEVVQHAISWLKKHEGEEYDYLMILQPTSPMRLSVDIDACIEKIVETNADSVMSMVQLVDISPEKIKIIKNDVILPKFEKETGDSARRQDEEPLYRRNCAVYLTKTEFIMKGELFGNVSVPYIMPSNRSIDINNLQDFELASFLMEKMKRGDF